MAIISFEIPTDKPEELSYIADIASKSRFKFSVCLNGRDLSPADEIRTNNLVAFYWPLRITEPCVSMMELRKAAAVRACQFHPDIRVIGDGNFRMASGWQEYVSEIADQLLEFERATGETGFVGMNGNLGGTSKPGCTVNKGRKIHIPMNPMIDTQRGIMYRSWPWDEIEVLPSGFEDHYLTSYLFRKLSAIPLSVGDMMFVPLAEGEDHNTAQNKISSAAAGWGKRRDRRFATQMIKNDGKPGIGVWRIE